MNDTNYKIEDILIELSNDKPATEIKIINAAIKNFSKNGYHNTKTKDIAKDAKIAEGTIFRYFKTKEDMLINLYPLALKIILPRVIRDLSKKVSEFNNLSISEFSIIIITDRINLYKANYSLFKALIPEILHRNKLKEQIILLAAPKIKKALGELIIKHINNFDDLEIETIQKFIFNTIFSYVSIGLINEDFLFRDELDSEIKTYVKSIFKP